MLIQLGKSGQWGLMAIMMCAALSITSTAVLAYPRQDPAPAPAQVSPQVAAQAEQQRAQMNADRLHMLVGRSLVITSPVRVRRVSIADPNIADAIIVSPNQILLNGKMPGAVSLVLWDENDQTQAFDVYVDLDILSLTQKIREVFPSEQVKVEANKEFIVLSGKVSSQEVADRIQKVVQATTPRIISLMEVPAPPAAGEILLEVKFAEVDRAALTQFGFNLVSTGGGNTVGTTGTQQFAPVQLQNLTVQGGRVNEIEFRFSDLLNVFVFRPDINLGFTLRALQQKNLLQILAEPNLLTRPGKEATFLAGGEFPFPVVQGGQQFTSVTIQFKEFGVRLSFTPTMTVDGRINLKVKPEVSALDFSNAVTLSGFLVPALSTRRVETEMELADGQSFAIAGLVDDRVTQSLQKVPVLGDIPILGHLFRSRSTSRSKTELLVIVTPRLVKPLEPGQIPPGPQFPKDFMPPATPEKGKPAADQNRPTAEQPKPATEPAKPATQP